jgi:hypothetical protein
MLNLKVNNNDHIEATEDCVVVTRILMNECVYSSSQNIKYTKTTFTFVE